MGGAQFDIYGEIRLDTGPAAQGVKQISSQIQGLAQSGIAGFEAVQQKVIAATKEVAALRNALLQTQDPARQAQLNAQLTEASTRLRAAKVEMRGMTLESRETNEKVQMLAASLGIRVPQGLAQILARMPAVQTAMELAFGGMIVVGFGAAIVALFPKIAEWIDMLRGVEAVNQDILNKEMELDRFLVSAGKPKSVKALGTEYQHVAGRIDEIKKKLVELQGAPFSLGRLEFGLRAATDLGLTMDRVKALRAELEPLQTRFEELKVAVPTEKQEEYNKALEDAAKHAKELFEAEWRLDYLYEHREHALETALLVYHKYAAATAKDLEKLPPLITDQEFALKNLPPVIRDLQGAHELANEAMVRDMKAQDEAAKKALQQQEQLAHGIESFIDRVFIQARSLSDVFHQFLMQTLGSFVKWISQMLAHWLTGIRQATAGAGGGVTGGGGGWLGSLLGGVFGLGGAVPAFATVGTGGEPGWSGAQSLTLPGGGYIQGITGPLGAGSIGTLGTGIPQAAGGGAQSVLGSLANLPTMLAGLGILGGVSLAGGGGPVRGALGGALVGGGIGFGLYSLGLLGGPWGLVLAGIGAAIGGLVGLFRRGGQKRKSAALEQGFEFAADDVLKQYELHKIDYENAISSLESLIASGQQTLLGAGTGRWGRQGSENLTRVIRDLIARVNDLEAQRQATTTTLAGMTIPEFAIGGPVGYRLPTGGILAIVHPGEFVIRREAVDALGENFLTRMNRAPAFASGGPVSPSSVAQHGGIHIHGDLILYPEKGMSKREAMEMVVEGFNLAVREGAL
jgi:hypothetical protein